MDTQGWLPKSNNMFDISNLQSAGGKRTELLEENYSIHCDQNDSKMILGHGKKKFSWRTLSSNLPIALLSPRIANMSTDNRTRIQ